MRKNFDGPGKNKRCPHITFSLKATRETPRRGFLLYSSCTLPVSLFLPLSQLQCRDTMQEVSKEEIKQDATNQAPRRCVEVWKIRRKKEIKKEADPPASPPGTPKAKAKKKKVETIQTSGIGSKGTTGQRNRTIMPALVTPLSHLQ